MSDAPSFRPMRSLHVYTIAIPSPAGPRMAVRPDDPSQPVAFLVEGAAREYIASHHLQGAIILVATFRLALGLPPGASHP